MTYVIDTHVLVWWLTRSGRLGSQQRKVLDQAEQHAPLCVCGISLWEIATLVSLGRLTLSLPLQEWLTRATAAPLVRVQGIQPTIAAAVAELPETFHRDPADRLIVATTRVLGATLLTSDRRIIDAGVVPTIT